MKGKFKMPENSAIPVPPEIVAMLTHKPKRTIAVDFDGVIHSYTSPWTTPDEIRDPPVPGAIVFLQRALSDGFEVVIQSVRATTPEGRIAMGQWLLMNGLSDVDCCRCRITHEKPQALVYLDDRAVRFTGMFPEPSELAAMKPWNR